MKKMKHIPLSCINKNITPYIASVQAIALTCCFFFLLFSCEEELPKSSDKKIDQLVLTVGSTDTPVTFDTDYNAALTVPFGTDLTAIMVKTLLVSAKATASVVQDDVLTITSGSAAITVTAENGSKQVYTIQVMIAPAPPRTGADITALTATILGQAYSTTGDNVAVVIMDNAIAITLPFDVTLPTNLPLTVLTLSSGASSVPSEGSPLPLTAGAGMITVTAEDGVTTRVYTVQVTIASPRTGVELTALTTTIAGQTYSTTGDNPLLTIMDNAIAIVLPFGSTLPASLVLTGLMLSPGASSIPAEGATLSLTAGVGTINVTAEDGTTMGVYTAQVTIASPRMGTEITALTATIAGQTYFSMGDNPLVMIEENAIAIIIPFGIGITTLPSGLSLTLLTLSPGASSVPAQGATLDLTAMGTGMISVQAEDPSVSRVSYTVSVTIFGQPVVTTYTGTDTLGIAVRDVVTEAGRSVSFSAMDTVIAVSGLADVSFDWALGMLSGTKTATAGALVLTQSDLAMFPATADATYAFTVSANGQTSEEKALFYYPGQLRTWRDLQGVRVNLSGTYQLMNDISFPDDDGDGVSSYNFEPLGRDTDVSNLSFQGDVFSGNFDGGGHEVKYLYIDRGAEGFIGLFGNINNGTVRNVGLTGGAVTGRSYVGGLVGFTNKTVQGVYATCTVMGTGFTVGGLVGHNNQGTIQGAYTTGAVTGESNNVGGLVGNNQGTIQGAYATGTVTGEGNNVGGLVGTNQGTLVGYARGNVIRTAGNTATTFGRLIGGVMIAASVTGYYSGATGESQLLSLAANGTTTPLTGTTGFDGEERTSASVQADFTGFEFDEEIGKWIFTAGRWPAAYLGDLQSAADQPTQ